MNWLELHGIRRIGSVYWPGVTALERVPVGVWAYVRAGWVWLIYSRVLVVDGVLRLDGVVRVGPDRVDGGGGCLLSVDGVLRVDGVLGVKNV